jgi:hypothetical protein
VAAYEWYILLSVIIQNSQIEVTVVAMVRVLAVVVAHASPPS